MISISELGEAISAINAKKYRNAKEYQIYEKFYKALCEGLDKMMAELHNPSQENIQENIQDWTNLLNGGSDEEAS